MQDQVISSFVIKGIPFLRGGIWQGTSVSNLSRVTPFICNSKSSTHIYCHSLIKLRFWGQRPSDQKLCIELSTELESTILLCIADVIIYNRLDCLLISADLRHTTLLQQPSAVYLKNFSVLIYPEKLLHSLSQNISAIPTAYSTKRPGC